jgi:long-chain fatty acid transport protein
MTRIKNGDLLIGAGALYGDCEFTSNALTTVDGNDGGVSVGWFPNGGLYYAHTVSDRVSLGLASVGNFGLTSGYDDGWVGRYYIESSTLLGISLLPSVGFRVNPKLSLGVSLNAMYGILENDVAVNPLAPTAADGELSLSTTDLAFGGNAGVLWEPSAKTRVGATYTSPVEFDFSDVPEFSSLTPALQAALQAAGLLDAELTMKMTVPQTVMASFYADLGEKWALVGDLGWQDWSAFGGVNVQVATDPPTGLSTQLPYKDTWRGALGAKRRLSGTWMLSGGVAYDTEIVTDEDRSVALPAGAVWRYAIGAQHNLNEKFDLGFGYTLMSCGDLPVDQGSAPSLTGRVAGAYESVLFHVFSLQAHWMF